MSRAIVIATAFAVASAAVFAGCGSTASVPAAETVTVVRETTTTVPQGDAAPDAQVSSGTIVVPNVVGKDHQVAQDILQGAGLYLLAEEDATGQGRALVWDRNWTVVRQSPRAGTQVDDDQQITLYSKKDSE